MELNKYNNKRENYINFINKNNLYKTKELDINTYEPETKILLQFLLGTSKGGELIKNNSRILYINPDKSGNSLFELAYFTGLPFTIISNDNNKKFKDETHINLIKKRE